MSRHLLVIWYLYAVVSASSNTNTTAQNSTAEKRSLNPFSQQSDGFMSRLSNWLFSSDDNKNQIHNNQFNDKQNNVKNRHFRQVFFRNNSTNSSFDLKPSDTMIYGNYYPPPSGGGTGGGPYPAALFPSTGDADITCNPCNQVPWIPIVGGGGGGHYPPPSIEYGPPIGPTSPTSGIHIDLPIPSFGYGPPSGPSALSTHDVITKLNPPNQDNIGGVYAPPFNEYGPPKIHYVPSKVQYGPPKPDYGPPKVEYGPPKQQYGPPRPDYGPPKPDYGPPKIEYGPPKQQYGPPKPQYIPPKIEYGPPKIQYGPPKPDYGPPKVQYGPPLKPPKPQYGPPLSLPKPPKNIYGPPAPPNKQYGPPPPRPSYQYGPPLSNLPDHMLPPPIQPPFTSYGPPRNNDHFMKIFNKQYAPPATYGTPNLPPPTYGPPQPSPNFSYGPPPVSPSYAPPQVSPSYGPPPTKPATGYLPAPLPSDSYGHPVTGNSLNFLQNAPVPNLSSQMIAPLYAHQDFHSGGAFHDSKPAFSENVQIVPSVKVADFISSIDHPINVIQSPLVDVTVKNTDLESRNEQKDETQQKLSENPIYVEDTYTAASNNVYNNTDYNAIYTNNTTSNTNNTGNAVNSISNSQKIIDSKKTKSNHRNIKNHKIKDNSVAETAETNEISNDFIEKLLKEHGISQTDVVDIKKVNDLSNLNFNNQNNIHTSSFVKQEFLNKSSSLNAVNNNELTTPQIDYGNWQPTKSYFTGHLPNLTTLMLPPPFQSPTFASTWSTSPVTMETSTKRPTKQIQIIIPYVNLPDVTTKSQFSALSPPPQHQAQYTTLVPVYTPPLSTEQSIWSQFVDDLSHLNVDRQTGAPFIGTTTLAPSTSTKVFNIQDLIGNQGDLAQSNHNKQLPYDVVSLQNNIDSWTQMSYSKVKNNKKMMKNSHKIPNDYFTTTEPSSVPTTTPTDTTTTVNILNDVLTLIEHEKQQFDNIVAESKTKEKVYIVTPQSVSDVVKATTTSPFAIGFSMAPKIEKGQKKEPKFSKKFTVRVEHFADGNSTSIVGEKKLKKDVSNNVKVVYSEWPHVINNLQVTTTEGVPSVSSSSKKKRHPLFGLMDTLPAAMLPDNATVETISGHSKVLTIVTPSSVKS